MLLGIGMDVIYQLKQLGTLFPGEAVIIALALAFLPYLLLSGPRPTHRPLVAQSAAARRDRMSDSPHVSRTSPSDDISVELSSRRTGMSFQRTRMSADRTLMSVIRTSLSLIGFGFTIFQFFEKLREAGTVTHAGSARNFGVALVLLGILMLIGGIIYHVQFMVHLREQRTAMMGDGLVHGESRFPVSLTLVTACILLLIGIFAIISMVFHAGPFG
jgi:putative membrane protein